MHDVAIEMAKSGAVVYDRYKSTLGDDMPGPLILPDSIVENSIRLENCTVELRSLQGGEAGVTSILYEPKQKLLFAGDIVYNKVHLYMLEQQLDGWLKELDELKKYSVSELYPGHGVPSGAGSIEVCINYIHTFQKALITNDPKAVFDIMNYYFPGYSKAVYLKVSIDKYLGVK